MDVFIVICTGFYDETDRDRLDALLAMPVWSHQCPTLAKVEFP
jgi:hypothetical protein